MNATDQLDLFACENRPEALDTRGVVAIEGFEFLLGTHHPGWLGVAGVPLFISQRRLRHVRNLPLARAPWALDSGGFTELSLHGRYMFSTAEYVGIVRRAQQEVRNLRWAASMDWMCEAEVLKRTGLDVAEHQRQTIAAYLDLMNAAPDLPWVPVLQGWTRGDYLDHLEAYAVAGVGLTSLPLVGVGTLCRRQHTLRAALLLAELKELGLKLHAFGFKASGLAAARDSLVSSDSLAWSLNARKNAPHPDCHHKRCSNCMRFALAWREELLSRLDVRR